MPIKTLVFLGGFIFCCIGALVVPMWGIIGSVLYYTMGTGWWTKPISHWELRYSFMLAIATTLGVILNWRKLRFGRAILVRQEKYTLLFLGIVWLATVFAETTMADSYIVSEHPSIKLSKIIIFSFLITHVVTRIKKLNLLFWVLILGAIHIGISAYYAPRSMFIYGRLENIGGTDFRGANDLAAFLAALIPIIGIMFLKTHWPGKILCGICGALACNTLVLTQSRVGLLGLVGGALVLVLFIPKRYRAKIIVCLIIAGIGFFSLMDTRYITRSKTIVQGAEIQDHSAQTRLDIWRGGVQMVKENPLGVGAGNFMQNIGRYSPQTENRDAHNTYIRCAAELGVHGFAVLVVLIINAFLMLRSIHRTLDKLPKSHRSEYQMLSGALAASIAAFVVAGLTNTLLYMEAFWWFLLLPVCLKRSLDNQLADIALREKNEESSSGQPGKKAFPGKQPSLTRTFPT